MVDAALIMQCADPSLPPAIVERFIERGGSQDPLAISVRSGNRVVLVPKPSTPDEAMALIRQHIGREIVRVGLTQYPAGLGLMEAGEVKSDLVDPCANLRMGTALFAKVYRIVTKWYGHPTAKEVMPQVFDDAIIAWQTGYFEGRAVFRAEDPRDVKLIEPVPVDDDVAPVEGTERADAQEPGAGDDVSTPDPYEAGIRIDLSNIGESAK